MGEHEQWEGNKAVRHTAWFGGCSRVDLKKGTPDPRVFCGIPPVLRA